MAAAGSRKLPPWTSTIASTSPSSAQRAIGTLQPCDANLEEATTGGR